MRKSPAPQGGIRMVLQRAMCHHAKELGSGVGKSQRAIRAGECDVTWDPVYQPALE